jgi:formate hydrogenlyase transcriptional activator
VIAATNRDLSGLVEEKTFRMDLFYRLNVFPITLPPLRGRREDIPRLAQHFIVDAAQRMQRPIRTIPPEAMQALMDHSWPGNVRELQNCIDRAVILSQDGVLRVPPFGPRRNVPGMPFGGTLEDVERDHILQVLGETGWVLGGSAGAARRLGLPRTTLISKMKKLGLRGARLSGHDQVSQPVSPNLPAMALPSYA